ncbi:hypothetical protein BDD12DRAFT_816897 [Trichophaea hybrida]|nr:hypothetical protein BDD12DRAFT_816897 [Trichophaea hybrida]
MTTPGLGGAESGFRTYTRHHEARAFHYHNDKHREWHYHHHQPCHDDRRTTCEGHLPPEPESTSASASCRCTSFW